MSDFKGKGRVGGDAGRGEGRGRKGGRSTVKEYEGGEPKKEEDGEGKERSGERSKRI